METILFVGDTHCGGHFGLWPQEFLGEDGAFRNFKGAQYLSECWRHFVEEELPKRAPDGVDLLVITGDVIEGTNYRGRHVGLHTGNLGEQVEGAIRCYRPLVEQAKTVIRVDGTPYHEDYHGNLKTFDVTLGVAKTQQIFDIDLGPGVLNVAHHPAGGSALYQGTKLDKEGIWSSIAAERRQVPRARWVVRAHLHNYAMQETQTKAVCLLPCWKLQDMYAKKGNYWAWQPTLGSVLMRADEANHSGYRFEPMLYDPLKPKVTNENDLKAEDLVELEGAA